MKRSLLVSIPPVHFFVALAMEAVAWWLVPQAQLLYLPVTLFGLVLVVLGWLLIMASFFQLRGHSTTVTYSTSISLVEKGVYGVSRNPMYVGAAILLFGTAWLFGNVVSFLGPVFFFLVIHFMFIPFEEAKAEREFGEQYRVYKQKVRRWL